MKIRVPYDRLGRYYYVIAGHISFEDLYNYNFNQYATLYCGTIFARKVYN